MPFARFTYPIQLNHLAAHPILLFSPTRESEARPLILDLSVGLL
jgi:hypothetical protein